MKIIVDYYGVTLSNGTDKQLLVYSNVTFSQALKLAKSSLFLYPGYSIVEVRIL